MDIYRNRHFELVPKISVFEFGKQEFKFKALSIMTILREIEQLASIWGDISGRL